MLQIERPSLLIHVLANALVRDDDSQTPLDVARINGHTSIVREIEVCLTDVEVKNYSKIFYLDLYGFIWLKFYLLFVAF